ncbi:hypothetical protein ABGB18_45860 [Nonomuraea sp. B12E4]|uniref:hypothetical protein n=1 Tax=Nonomuraea sp. B12E4 TaxID=3153564 RepID=UPI00325EBE93
MFKNAERKAVPPAVLIASILQFLLGATFVIVAANGARFGRGAQSAAETEVSRQGFPTTVLTRSRIDFGAGRASVVVAVCIGLCLVALAALNLTGNGTGQILSWIVQSLIFVLGCLIMPGEVFLVRGIESTFKKSGDPALRSIDVKALVDAAVGAVPAWSRYVIAARFVLATVGSVLVIVLLMIPSASAHFG